MIKYIKGAFKNLTNPAVSLFCKVDNLSEIDRKAKINRFTQVFASEIGAYSYLGRHSSLVHANIGKFCSIGDEVKVGLAIHTLSFLSTSPIFSEKSNGTGFSWVESSIVEPYKKVVIGNDVWIGERVMIMGGINIGDGAVIGAGAIVTKDVPPYAIVAGVPAKVLRFRFSEERIKMLQIIKWWDKSEAFLIKHISEFQKEDFNEKKLKD